MKYWKTLSVELRAIESRIPLHHEFRHALIVVVRKTCLSSGFKIFRTISQLERKKFAALLLQLPVEKGHDRGVRIKT